MSKDLSNYRDKYFKGELIEKNLPKDPFDLFDNWFEDLEKFVMKEKTMQCLYQQ